MSLTFGFYNSNDGDRKYKAEDFSGIFEGIIEDGVFSTVGNCFMVTSITDPPGMVVSVGTGRAWFNGTWTYNDEAINITIESPANPHTLRTDTVVLQVDLVSRENSITIVQGADGNSQPPTLTNSGGVYQHPLANILVRGGSTSIVQSDITNLVGTSACPFVSAALQTVTVDNLLLSWSAEFTEWFDNVKGQLSEDAAGHLQNEIDALTVVANEASRGIKVFESIATAWKSSGKATINSVKFYSSNNGRLWTFCLSYRVVGGAAVGENLMTGTISAYASPIFDAVGCSYNGSSIQHLYVSPNGQFVLRNLGAALPSGTVNSTIAVTYMANLDEE